MEPKVVAHILIVEDNADLCRMIEQNLKFEGFTVAMAGSGEAGLASYQAHRADLIILDLMLPGMNGLEVLRRLRQGGERVPVLMLTALGEEKDRVRGLASGADDYLVKPFSMLEFLERVKAILRRTLPAPGHLLLSGPFRMATQTMVLLKDGADVGLTSKEFRILEVLLVNAGITFSRSEILKRAWEPDAWPTPRSIDAHIARIRKKLGDDDGKGWILTVGGEGYRWTLPTTSP